MLTIETQSGEAIDAGSLRLVPVARSWRLKLGWLGLVWNRASRVTVFSDGQETTIPVRDETRRLQLILLGAGALGALWLWLAGRRRR